ncbi:zinc knuckle family protein [Wuchereria bancrofti]|uniref:Zinc knuckle family protein n=1 Tax=Wuchereria bancrofti TaxID=6293 RepID=J9EEL6_WUCBA|nr:zinc knuckle family protein [Wuchereria bancrofti]
MAFTIIESIKPVKDRLERLLSEINPTLPNHERLQINETKDLLIDEKILRLQMCIDSIEALNKQWIECAQKSKTKKENYAQTATGERNIFILKHEAKETIITLTMYKRKINNEIKQITSKRQ